MVKSAAHAGGRLLSTLLAHGTRHLKVSLNIAVMFCADRAASQHHSVDSISQSTISTVPKAIDRQSWSSSANMVPRRIVVLRDDGPASINGSADACNKVV